MLSLRCGVCTKHRLFTVEAVCPLVVGVHFASAATVYPNSGGALQTIYWPWLAR